MTAIDRRSTQATDDAVEQRIYHESYSNVLDAFWKIVDDRANGYGEVLAADMALYSVYRDIRDGVTSLQL